MITPEIHLFPFRTEKLSLVVPMVLPFGERVGNHLFFFFYSETYSYSKFTSIPREDS